MHSSDLNKSALEVHKLLELELFRHRHITYGHSTLFRNRVTHTPSIHFPGLHSCRVLRLRHFVWKVFQHVLVWHKGWHDEKASAVHTKTGKQQNYELPKLNNVVTRTHCTLAELNVAGRNWPHRVKSAAFKFEQCSAVSRATLSEQTERLIRQLIFSDLFLFLDNLIQAYSPSWTTALHKNAL